MLYACVLQNLMRRRILKSFLISGWTKQGQVEDAGRPGHGEALEALHRFAVREAHDETKHRVWPRPGATRKLGIV